MLKLCFIGYDEWGAINLAINVGQLTNNQLTLPKCKLYFISGHSLEYSMIK